MSALRKLGVCYLVSASAFAMAATFAAHPDLARDLNTRIWSPAADFARRQDMTFFDAPYVSARIDLPPEEPVARLTLAPPPEGIAAAPVQSLILPDLTPLPAPAMPDVAAPDAPAVSPPRFAIAPSDVPSDTARNESPPPAAARIAQARLEDSLSPEMRAHFDLFLYVSKAERGPVAQRMYVFAKDDAGRLRLAYDWAASTGREKSEVNPRGRRSFTATPRGFYELDPARMYRAYHSVSWDQDMPYAMFFNWERQGLQTGLAIHSATGADIARLGQRASAGCVHLSPENAATLYRLIRADYRGAVPRFAYDRATATMSNDGEFARDAKGDLKMAEGYKVLIEIEDFGGGDNTVAALY